ncbi:MAG: hypothetical protein ABIV50_14590 [Opitutus sp.]
MKRVSTGLALMVLVSTGFAADVGPAPAAPLPRAKLDPATLPTVRPPRTDDVATNDPIALEKMVVRQRPLPIGPRRAVEDSTGRFTPMDGGRFYRRDAGPFRFEAGIWPTIELFDEEARFKGTQTKISFDFLRIKW